MHKSAQINLLNSHIIVMNEENEAEALRNAIAFCKSIKRNMRRFLRFQITISISLVIINFISTVLIREFVLPPIELLWINIIMDSLASFALAFEE